MKQFNFMLTLLSIFLISGSLFAQEKTAIKSVEVTASELTARAGASKEHKSLGKFKKDDVLPVFSVSGDWYETQCPAELKVYVFQKYITVTGNNGIISGEGVNGRAGPSEDSAVLFKFNAKTQVDVLGVEGGWIKIAPPPQATSWIAKQFVVDAANAEVAVEGTTKKKSTKKEEPVEDTAVEEVKQPEKVTKESGKKHTPVKAKGGDTTTPEVQRLLDEAAAKKEAIKDATVKIQKDILEGEEENKFLKTGWVRRLGRVIGRTATHALYVSEGTDLCYLISKEDSIKLEDYANKYVGIKGEDIGKEKRSDVSLISVTKIVILENGPSKIRLNKPSAPAEKPAKEDAKDVKEATEDK